MDSTSTDNTSTKLLNIILHLYFQDIDTFKQNNYLNLKQALYCWVICNSDWNVKEFNTLELKYNHLLLVDLGLNYSQFLRIEELEYEISRFIDFGDMYWQYEPTINSDQYQWKVETKVNKKSLIVLILRYIKNHLVHI